MAFSCEMEMSLSMRTVKSAATSTIGSHDERMWPRMHVCGPSSFADGAGIRPTEASRAAAMASSVHASGPT